MLGLIQRVSSASVAIENRLQGNIDQGILLLLGVEKNDDQDNADQLLKKILNYRIFNDELGKMNLSLNDIGGGLLVVSQFTLAADTKKGLRPSFSSRRGARGSRQQDSCLRGKYLREYPGSDQCDP